MGYESNQTTYIATFFSHFGAIRFKRYCEQHGFEAQAMPVPRDLSSSCGTCVRFLCINEQKDLTAGGFDVSNITEHLEEIEQIVKIVDDKYEEIYKIKD